MVQALARRKVTPVSVEWMNYGEDNSTGQYDQDRREQGGRAHPCRQPDASIAAVKSAAALGVKIPIVSHWGVRGGRFWKELHQDLEKMDIRFPQTVTFSPPASNRKARDLAKRYLQEYGIDKPENIPVPPATAQAYDLVHLLAMAIRRAGSLQRPAIRDSLEKLDPYQGAVKAYNPPFTRERHDALFKEDIFMARYNRQGHVVPVSPIDDRPMSDSSKTTLKKP